MVNNYSINKIFNYIFHYPKLSKEIAEKFLSYHILSDKVMLILMVLQWIIATFVTSAYYDTYIYGFVGGALIVFPLLLIFKIFPGELFFRVSVAIGMMLFSLIFIQQYMGRIEMHFHVFIAMAILTIYKDIIPIIVAAFTTILHHLVFNYLQLYEMNFFDMPVMVFNYGCGLDIVFLHAIFVVIELLVLGYMVRLQIEYSAELYSVQKRANSLNETLHYRSTHDMLTGLANRARLNFEIERIKETAEEKQQKFAMLFLDLDHFKNINDTLGHDVGDALLQATSSILSKKMPNNTFISRIGGDEFVLILEELENSADIIPHIEALLEEFKRDIYIKGYTLRFSGSIGISIYPDDSTNIKELMKYADIAMYQAKKDGRDGFSFFTSTLNKDMHDEVRLINDMKRALENNEFELYFQPKVEIATRKVIGAEALIRWNHPEKGLISPDMFISLAEKTGQIFSLGSFVISSCIKTIEQLNKLGLEGMIISLNVSSRQFQNEDLYQELSKNLTASGVDPRQLGIEITEGIMMKNTDATLSILQDIKKLGISIYVDDFGTGYSSLAYLKTFPVDVLKIDKRFVDDIKDSPQNRAVLLDTIIAMGNTMDLKVIAEGVEHEYQVKYLQEKKCDIIQGYYFARPLPFDAFLAYVKESLL